MTDSGGQLPKSQFRDVPLELHVEHFQLAPVAETILPSKGWGPREKGRRSRGALLDCDQLLATCAVGSSRVARLAYELIYHEPTLAYGRSRRKAVAWDAIKPYMLDEPGFLMSSKWP